MRLKIIILVGIIIVLIIGGIWFTQKRSFSPLPTYFSYNDAIKSALVKPSSEYKISMQDLKKWDFITFNLVKENKIGDAYASRIYAYLYLAQREVANLSYNVKHQFMGSVDPISAKVLCYFFNKRCTQINKQALMDDYSETLANAVFNQILSRLQKEQANTHPYPIKTGKDYWQGAQPYFALEVGSWTPWFMLSAQQFRVPPPPSPDSPQWAQELASSKETLSNITPEQKRAVVFWAGNPGTITPPGQWLMLATNYMIDKKINLETFMQIRALLAMGLMDAIIAVFDSKYTYWVKRPNMLDPSMETVMPTPNHPSYPAGHATLSGAASTILGFYLPENLPEWKKAELEASFSRVWGGIHFNIDTSTGLNLGNHVGENVIKANSSVKKY